jgi:hypothetical protein
MSVRSWLAGPLALLCVLAAASPVAAAPTIRVGHLETDAAPKALGIDDPPRS